MKTTFKYDHYFKYDEIKSNLEKLAKKHGKLMKVETNCITEEGRSQFVVTLTNTATGDAMSKPGWYLDGNIHAGEVTASMAAMYMIDYLVTNYGKDKKVTKLLDGTTIYVIPRVTPDGAETYLSTPYTLRSVNRDYMGAPGGIQGEDLDGDGVIRMMRIPTVYGAWKKDPKNSGCMVKRDPGDVDGEFYDIYPEGLLESFDGEENLKSKRTNWGLDFNRNFPYGWFPDARQPGAGKYPLSNIETKAIVDFVLAHPNIGGASCGHTSGGLLLYPPGTKPSSTAPSDDVQSLIEIANMGKEELDYKPLNIFDSFVHSQEFYDSGALDDWFYQSQGIPAYTVEFWDLATKVGVPVDWEDKKPRNPEKEIERFNACMKWVKENAPQYYSDWKAFDHPQFGKVEIGGFNYKFTHQNPPEHMLLKECENFARFGIRFASAMPHLSVDSVYAEKVKAGIYKVTAVVGNLGYLPTNLTDEAIHLKTAKPVEVSLSGAEIVSGKEKEEIGNLSGYSRTRSGVFFYGNISTSESATAKKKLSWIVKGAAGDVVTITAAQEKSGTASAQVTL